MRLSKTLSRFVQTLAILCLTAPTAAHANTADVPTSEPEVREPEVREPAVREPAVREPAVREPAVREPAVREPPAPPPRPRRPQPKPVEPEEDSGEMTAPKYVSLSGPRVGVSFLQGKSFKSLQERVEGAYPFVTTLGWQFEHAWLSGDDGTAGLVEIVPTVSGFNQSLFIPGVNALFGVRSGSGLEFAVGGQVAVVGGQEMFSAGALFAAGVTVHTKSLNFPIDLIWVSSQQSNRIGIVVGFSAITK